TLLWSCGGCLPLLPWPFSGRGCLAPLDRSCLVLSLLDLVALSTIRRNRRLRGSAPRALSHPHAGRIAHQAETLQGLVGGHHPWLPRLARFLVRLEGARRSEHAPADAAVIVALG